ncbi:MAG: two-component regulator propeller domain-containing protein [Bacteroidota bacterium]
MGGMYPALFYIFKRKVPEAVGSWWKQMKPKIFLFIILLISLTSCNGQSTSGTHNKQTAITIGERVTELSNSIIIVFQSANGTYWFGSDKDGVYCVDGKTIIHFSTKHGLSDNRIRSIQEDKQGNIYISTLGGINKFDGQTLTTLTPIKENNWKLKPDDLWFSMVGKSGDKGPYRYDGKNLYQLEFPKHYMEDEYFTKFPGKAWSPYEVYHIYKDRKGTMWFGTSNFGVCRYDVVSFSWLYEDQLTNVPNGGSFGIRSIYEDTKGKFWICNTRQRFNIIGDSITADGKSLITYNTATGIEGIKATDGADHVYFMSIVEDKTGDLWMATYEQGVWRYDGEKVIHYDIKNGTNEVTLFSVYKDRNDSLWLGTHETGVYKFDGTAFVKFRP